MSVGGVIEGVLGTDLPVAVQAYDGSRAGPRDAPATIVVRSPDALRRILTCPGELGLARAYVAGDLDIEGDVFAVLDLRHRVPDLDLGWRQYRRLLAQIGLAGLRPLPPPPEEARQRGRRHSESRDREAVSHHYDVGNEFYRLVLGPSMTYSCAVFEDAGDSLEAAQRNKYELIGRKLGLDAGSRLLDVGCGWGGMALHAAQAFGARATGVSIADQQVQLARARVAEAGLGDRVDIRNQDYRAVGDGPYDAVSSIGMFEHVGAARLTEYFTRLRRLLRPGGRLLNHGISRPPGRRPRFARRGFIDRYVFPDGELHEIGSVISVMQAAGFEVRHVESLREHYALTLRRWVANLEAHWDRAVELVGPNRARVWRLYMAGSAAGFEEGTIQIHQVLGVRSDAGRSGMALRPTWERTRLSPEVDLSGNGSGPTGTDRLVGVPD